MDIKVDMSKYLSETRLSDFRKFLFSVTHNCIMVLKN